MKKRIYLAGPDVFLPNPAAAGERKKQLAAQYGFEGVFPLDATLNIQGLPLPQAGFAISDANENLMRTCHLIIANLTPFRGPSADVGTVYEVGFARALGLPVWGYTNTTDTFSDRTLAALGYPPQTDPASVSDPHGMHLEHFELTDNLMIDGGIHFSGGQFIKVSVPDNELFTNLQGFEECLKRIPSS